MLSRRTIDLIAMSQVELRGPPLGVGLCGGPPLRLRHPGADDGGHPAAAAPGPALPLPVCSVLHHEGHHQRHHHHRHRLHLKECWKGASERPSFGELKAQLLEPLTL